MKLCLRCNQYFEDGIEACPIDTSRLESVGDHPLIGALINDRYVVDSVIGKGSSGIVYKATRLLMGREVAVKVLHSYLGADTGSLDRFLREAKAAARLKHPNIINIWESGVTDDAQPYFVMDYLEGMTLADLIKEKGYIHTARALPIMQQVCEALAEAHRLGIVHRDIKPENIVLQANEGDFDDFVKVLDFGIADQPTGQEHQRQKTAAGSPAYMSPEQCQGFRLDHRSDIYSLGIVVFELLTGERPFNSEDVMTLFKMHVTKPSPPLSSIRPDLKFSDQLEKVVAKAIAKKPENRHQSITEFQKELEEALANVDAPLATTTKKKVETTANDFLVPDSDRLTVSTGQQKFLPGPEELMELEMPEQVPAASARSTGQSAAAEAGRGQADSDIAAGTKDPDVSAAVNRLLKSAKRTAEAFRTTPEPPSVSNWAREVLTRPTDSGQNAVTNQPPNKPAGEDEKVPVQPKEAPPQSARVGDKPDVSKWAQQVLNRGDQPESKKPAALGGQETGAAPANNKPPQGAPQDRGQRPAQPQRPGQPPVSAPQSGSPLREGPTAALARQAAAQGGQARPAGGQGQAPAQAPGAGPGPRPGPRPQQPPQGNAQGQRPPAPSGPRPGAGPGPGAGSGPGPGAPRPPEGAQAQARPGQPQRPAAAGPAAGPRPGGPGQPPQSAAPGSPQGSAPPQPQPGGTRPPQPGAGRPPQAGGPGAPRPPQGAPGQPQGGQAPAPTSSSAPRASDRPAGQALAQGQAPPSRPPQERQSETRPAPGANAPEPSAARLETNQEPDASNPFADAVDKVLDASILPEQHRAQPGKPDIPLDPKRFDEPITRPPQVSNKFTEAVEKALDAAILPQAKEDAKRSLDRLKALHPPESEAPERHETSSQQLERFEQPINQGGLKTPPAKPRGIDEQIYSSMDISRFSHPLDNVSQAERAPLDPSRFDQPINAGLDSPKETPERSAEPPNEQPEPPRPQDEAPQSEPEAAEQQQTRLDPAKFDPARFDQPVNKGQSSSARPTAFDKAIDRVLSPKESQLNIPASEPASSSTPQPRQISSTDQALSRFEQASKPSPTDQALSRFERSVSKGNMKPDSEGAPPPPREAEPEPSAAAAPEILPELPPEMPEPQMPVIPEPAPGSAQEERLTPEPEPQPAMAAEQARADEAFRQPSEVAKPDISEPEDRVHNPIISKETGIGFETGKIDISKFDLAIPKRSESRSESLLPPSKPASSEPSEKESSQAESPASLINPFDSAMQPPSPFAPSSQVKAQSEPVSPAPSDQEGISAAVSRLIEAAKRAPEAPAPPPKPQAPPTVAPPAPAASQAKPEALNRKIEAVKKRIEELKGDSPASPLPSRPPSVQPEVPRVPQGQADQASLSDAVNRLLEAAQNKEQTIPPTPSPFAPPGYSAPSGQFAQPAQPAEPPAQPMTQSAADHLAAAQRAAQSAQDLQAASAQEPISRAAEMINALKANKSYEGSSDYYSGFKVDPKALAEKNKATRQAHSRVRTMQSKRGMPIWIMVPVALAALGGVIYYAKPVELYNIALSFINKQQAPATVEQMIQAGRLAEARDALEKKKATAKEPDKDKLQVQLEDVYIRLANQDMDEKNYKEALKELQKIARRSKRYSEARKLIRDCKKAAAAE